MSAAGGDRLATTGPARLLVVTGMRREARLAEGPGTDIVLSGGDTALLRRRLDERRPETCAAVLSFGLAGGLATGLAPGTLIVGTEVRSAAGAWPAHAARAGAIAERLKSGGLPVRLGALAGSDLPLTDIRAKAALAATTGALAVDMESHIAAAHAAAHGVPLLALRVICDPAERDVPALAVGALRPDGGTDLRPILRGLLREPAQLPALLRLAGDARAAFAALSRCRDLLGIGRSGADLRELLGDVA